MKNLLIIALCLASFSLSAQNAAKVFETIGKGDVATLASYLDDDLELCLKNEPDIFTKDEAIAALKKFFDNVEPKSCSAVHKGASKSKASGYSIGKLSCSGQTLRVFVYFKDVGGKYLIQELRFTEED